MQEDEASCTESFPLSVVTGQQSGCDTGYSSKLLWGPVMESFLQHDAELSLEATGVFSPVALT